MPFPLITGFNVIITNALQNRIIDQIHVNYFFRAAMGNKMKIAEILLDKGADIEAKNMMDLTPFLIAVIHGSKETAEMLLDRGANLMAIDSAHNGCLHLAVIHKRKEILQMLLDRGKGKLMELRNNELKSVIHLAACNEEMEVN